MSPVIFLGAFKRVTEEERVLLASILQDPSRDADFTPAVSPPAPPPAPPGHADVPPDGEYRLGDVSATWRNGRPVQFTYVPNPRRTATLPEEGWLAITRYFPASAQVIAPYVSFLESDFRLTAHNPNTAREDSWGPWQVNRNAWPQFSEASLQTWEGAALAASYILSVQGWRAWLQASRMLGILV